MSKGATKFTVLYKRHGEVQHRRGSLPDLRSLVLSELAPVRDIPNYHGQRHRVGFYASTKVGRHLHYESGLERLRLQSLDFDREVTTFRTQPFTLEWEQDGRIYHYTPDVMVVRSSGKRAVEDVKPACFHDRPKNLRAFGAADEALASVGISFELWAPPEPAVVHNLQYLAGYRRTPAMLLQYMRPILAALRERPHTLEALAEEVGPPPFTLPVIYYLIWNHRIGLNMTLPLSLSSLLTWKGGEA